MYWIEAYYLNVGKHLPWKLNKHIQLNICTQPHSSCNHMKIKKRHTIIIYPVSVPTSKIHVQHSIQIPSGSIKFSVALGHHKYLHQEKSPCNKTAQLQRYPWGEKISSSHWRCLKWPMSEAQKSRTPFPTSECQTPGWNERLNVSFALWWMDVVCKFNFNTGGLADSEYTHSLRITARVCTVLT